MWKKIFTLFTLIAGPLGLCTTAHADEYATNWTETDRSTHGARYLRSVSVTAEGGEAQTYEVSSGTRDILYHKKLDSKFVVEAGQEMTVTANYAGEWMNAYVYVDLGNDGSFSYDVDETAHTALAGSDLRAFSFWSFNSASDASGWDSAGNSVWGDSRSSVVMPSFTAPTEAGTYRMRLKIDWNNIDPAGATSASAWGSLQSNGGVIVDFTLEVTGGEPAVEGLPVPYSINFGDSQEGWTALDQSTVPGVTWNFSTRAFYDSGTYYPGMITGTDYEADFNDYYVSPAFSLKAGTYTVKTMAFKTSSGPTASLHMGTSATDAAGFTKVSDLELPESYSENAMQEFEVVVEADGVYYFAILGQVPLYNPATIGLLQFSIAEAGSVEPEPEEGLPVPYGIDFSDSQEGWTALDESSVPGTTWIYSDKAFYSSGTYYPGMKTDMDYVAECNDYYVSPALSLKAGTYTVKTLAFKSSSGPTASLHMGTSATDAAAFAKIGDLELLTDYNENAMQEFEVVVEADGVYYFAILGQVPIYNPASVSLFHFSIAEKGGSVDPEPVEETVPYAVNFKETSEGWVATDRNADGKTWVFVSDVGVTVDNSASTDDDYTSPLFELEAGKTYKLKTVLEGMMYNEALRISIWAGTDADNLTEVKNALQLPVEGKIEEETEFTPTEGGKYIFVIRMQADEGSPTYFPLYMSAFSIEEKKSEVVIGTPVFTADFTGENPLEGWTTDDRNADGETWKVETGTEGIVYNSEIVSAESNDWLVSPAIGLEAGQDYTVSYTLAQSSAFEADVVEVYWGEGNAAELTNLLGTDHIYMEHGNGTYSQTYRLTATKTGDAYIGFAVKNQMPNGKLVLKSLVVTPVEKAVPNGVTELAAVANPEEQTVKLDWVNPSTDTKGIALTGNLKVALYANDNLITTLESQTPGEAATYSYAPETFAGKVTYMAKAIIGENESEGATVTINLDDYKGDLELVHSFADVNRETASEWVIENKAGTSEWAFAYYNIFEFNYKLGQKNDEDWLISPAVELKAENRYLAKYELSGSENFASNVDVTMGNEQNSAAQQQVLASYPNFKQNGFGVFETAQFTVAADGNYYFGFKVTRADYSVSMRNLEIYRVSEKSTGLEDATAEERVLSYNGATAVLTVPVAGSAVSVYDLQGRFVALVKADGNQADLSVLAEGIYVVRAAGLQGRAESLKIVK